MFRRYSGCCPNTYEAFQCCSFYSQFHPVISLFSLFLLSSSLSDHITYYLMIFFSFFTFSSSSEMARGILSREGTIQARVGLASPLDAEKKDDYYVCTLIS